MTWRTDSSTAKDLLEGRSHQGRFRFNVCDIEAVNAYAVGKLCRKNSGRLLMKIRENFKVRIDIVQHPKHCWNVVDQDGNTTTAIAFGSVFN